MWRVNTIALVEAHLHDIGTVLDEERDLEEHDEAPMINFEKWTHLKEKALDAMRYRDIRREYNEDGLDTAMDYLKQQLKPIGIDDEFSAELQVLSDGLRQNEEEIQNNEAMQSVGFKK